MILREITNYSVLVSGYMRPGEGWSVVKDNECGQSDVRKVKAMIQIEEVSGGYLVLFSSNDKSVYCDDWFETLDHALEYCKDEYSIHHWKSI